MIIYKIDINGVYEDMYQANLKENTYYNGEKWLEIDFDYVKIQPPNAKVVKWENGEWVVIEEYLVESPQLQQPTIEERLESAENTILTLLFM